VFVDFDAEWDERLQKSLREPEIAVGPDGDLKWPQSGRAPTLAASPTNHHQFIHASDDHRQPKYEPVLQWFPGMLQTRNPAASSVPAEPGRSREKADARAQIWELLKQDKEEEAWRILRPYLVQPSSEPALQALACRFKRLPELAAGMADPCEKALSSAKPDNPWPFTYAAQTAMVRKERAQALLHVREAMRRGDKSGTLRADDWIWLAGLLRQLGAATWSEDALGRAGTTGSADAMRTELDRARRVWGLPKVEGDSLLSPEQESGYVDL